MEKPTEPLFNQVVISAPSTLDSEYRERLEGMKNVSLSLHDGQNQPFTDIGDNTLVLISSGETFLEDIISGVLPEQLKTMATRCEYPVLLIVGSPFPRTLDKTWQTRSVAGFLSYLELFTRIRTIQTPNRRIAMSTLQVMAKQTQYGFKSLGLDDL